MSPRPQCKRWMRLTRSKIFRVSGRPSHRRRSRSNISDRLFNQPPTTASSLSLCFRTGTSIAFVSFHELCGLVGDKVFHPLDEKPVALGFVDRRIVTCAYRVKLFLSRERLN